MSESESGSNEERSELSQEELRAEFDAGLAERRHKVEQMKADALAAGKEPFDLDRLFEFYVMRSKPSEARRERSIARWERDYYAGTGQRFMVIEDYAKHLNEVDVYDGG